MHADLPEAERKYSQAGQIYQWHHSSPKLPHRISFCHLASPFQKSQVWVGSPHKAQD